VPVLHEQNHGEYPQPDSEEDRNDLQDDRGKSGTAEADYGSNSATPEGRTRGRVPQPALDASVARHLCGYPSARCHKRLAVSANLCNRSVGSLAGRPSQLLIRSNSIVGADGRAVGDQRVVNVRRLAAGGTAITAVHLVRY
jgi:hypothetical protein